MKNKAVMISALLALLATGAYIISGCQGSSLGLTPPLPHLTGIIYVANIGTDSILSFNSASTIDGDKAPSRTLAGAATTIANPYHIFLDNVNDRLYIANSNADSVLVYDNASTATGDTAPTRILAGAATNLDQPEGIFVDTIGNILYVANFVGSSITIYHGASNVNGNSPPTRQITDLGDTPCGIEVDAKHNILYCSLSGTDTIGVWDNATTVDGAIPPNRTLAGPATRLDVPDGLYVDSTNDRLYVANPAGQSVTIFNYASTSSGNIAPTRTLIGANTLLNDPRGLTIDTANNRLFVTNVVDNSISIFNNASTVNGDTAPTRRIAGAATTLNTPLGIAVDMTRNGTP